LPCLVLPSTDSVLSLALHPPYFRLAPMHQALLDANKLESRPRARPIAEAATFFLSACVSGPGLPPHLSGIVDGGILTLSRIRIRTKRQIHVGSGMQRPLRHVASLPRRASCHRLSPHQCTSRCGGLTVIGTSCIFVSVSCPVVSSSPTPFSVSSKVKLKPLPQEYPPIDHTTLKTLFHRRYLCKRGL
jgi:hypothetical protein